MREAAKAAPARVGGALQVRTARPADVPAVLRLTAGEGWGYERRDIARLLDLTPRGFLVAEAAGRVVGCLTVLFYGEPTRLAWIGNVVVDAARRGTGAGRALMQAALAACGEAAAPHVYLDAFPPAVGFYLRLGFVEETTTRRWARERPGTHATALPARGGDGARVRQVRAADLPALAAADRAVFGADRTPLLTRLLRDYTDTAWLAEAPDGSPRAWLFARAHAGAAEIGPWCGEAGAARAVFAHALERLDGFALELSAPEDNADASGALAAAGFARIGHHVRMRLGAPLAWDRARTWALAGLEKG